MIATNMAIIFSLHTVLQKIFFYFVRFGTATEKLLILTMETHESLFSVSN